MGGYLLFLLSGLSTASSTDLGVRGGLDPPDDGPVVRAYGMTAYGRRSKTTIGICRVVFCW